MNVTLPPEVLKTLPAPDRNGLVRAVVSLRVGQDGSASIAQINDVPVPAGDDESAEDEQEPNPSAAEPTEQDGSPMPSTDDIDRGMYAPSPQP